MDPTVPAGAARLLDFIRDTEVGTETRPGYDVIFGFNQNRLPKPVTSMTIDEVLASQRSWTQRFGSSATGGYQFMRATLGGLKTELRLRGGQVLDPNLQDRLGFHLLKRRGYESFVSGRMDVVEFGKRLAQEWASFPVLAAVKGAHQPLTRGQSYYAGDRLNKALVPPERVEAVLAEVLELAKASAAAPIAKPEGEPDPELFHEPEAGELILPVEPHAPKEPAVPVPTPIEQASKAAGAAKGAAKGSAVAGALVTLLLAFGWLPDEMNTAEVGAAIGIVVTALAATVQATIDAYRAPPNAG